MGPRPTSVNRPHDQKATTNVFPSKPKGRWQRQGLPKLKSPQEQKNVVEGSRYGQIPDELRAVAKIRVTKFEFAISATGEDDPIVVILREALKQARRQTETPPVEDRIKSTRAFIEWARKRVAAVMEEFNKAKQKLVEKEEFLFGAERRLEGNGVGGEGEAISFRAHDHSGRRNSFSPCPSFRVGGPSTFGPQQIREEVEELRNIRVEMAKLRTERTRGGSHSDHSHPMDHSGGSRMAALIDASDAKVHVLRGRTATMRNSRCG